MRKECVYLIDATAFCYRAFYALKGLNTSFGQPTNAIYGFVSILNKILKAEKPKYLAICFDVSRDTFRAKKFAQYKVQRPPMPDGLSSQIPLIKEVVRAYNLTIFEKEGFEADDIIASLAKKAKHHGFGVTIVSSDKDILQLVDESTLVLSPYKDQGLLYDLQKVRERFGVEPKQITDIIALMGDSADNIPSVPGVGEKTAAGLIVEFGSLEQLLHNIDRVKQEKVRVALQEHSEQIRLSKELAVLDEDMELDFDPHELEVKDPNIKELSRIFKRLEFKKLLRDLPQEEDELAAVTVIEVSDEEVNAFFDKKEEVVIYAENPQETVFGVNNKFFRVKDSGRNTKMMLEDADIKKVGHDLKKTKVAFAKEGIALAGLYFDTMIAAYLINPSRTSYSLSEVVLDYLGVFIKEDGVDPAKAAGLIWKLEPVLERLLQEKSLDKLFFELEMPLVAVLAGMELDGISLDVKVLTQLSRDIEKRLIRLIEDIYEQSGTQFNINSTKQLREILFERLKLPVVRKGKTGPSTDEEVLRKLADKHPLPKFLLEYRQLTKLKNTYIDTLPELLDKRTGKIHSEFNQTGTETGRLSSSNPNLQNIPVKTDIGRNIRRSIIASGKENLLISCDYSQVELRILAHLSKDEHLIQAFEKDKDIHKATAGLIYAVSENEVSDAMREVSKRVNFGIVYGLTFFGLSRDLGISAEAAQGFIDAYFTTYPKVKEYIDSQISKAQKDGFVTTILGRRRYLPEINNKNQTIRQMAERQAVNTPIQGSASDLIKLAMVDIQKEILGRKLRARMILQIHDELLFDVDKEELDQLIGLVRDRMEHVLKLDVPVKVDIKKGKNWLEMEPVN